MPLSVPKPAVQVNVSENSIHGIYVGHNVTLGCLAMVDSSVNTNVSVSATWRLEGSVISSTPRTIISEKVSSAKNVYLSELLVIEIDDEFEGSYMCRYEVIPVDSSGLVLPVEASDELVVTVQG